MTHLVRLAIELAVRGEQDEQAADGREVAVAERKLPHRDPERGDGPEGPHLVRRDPPDELPRTVLDLRPASVNSARGRRAGPPAPSSGRLRGERRHRLHVVAELS